jgi:hypothetical protein
MFDEYEPIPAPVTAMCLREPPSRLNMMSNVYNAEGNEFVAAGMPVVGDYLIKRGKHFEWKARAAFETTYRRA